MLGKEYIVRLTDEERALCEDTLKRLGAASQKARRAHILLLADVDGPDAWSDAEIAKTCRCRTATVESVRRRCGLEGFERALNGKQRDAPPVPKLLDGQQGAESIALRLGPPLEGYAQWSLRLLARCVVELGIVESISHETVSQTLKNGLCGRKLQYWVNPPEADAEFAAGLEGVLATYAQPYDAQRPVLCMDEQPVQLVRETRTPVEAPAAHPRRVDHEYERAGTAAVFMFTEPLAAWRGVTARSQRTKVDWAEEVAAWLDGRYAHCERVTLVCEHLNTHTPGAFYKAFEPGRARDLVRRLEFRYTPTLGSWLNVAKSELSALTRQCMHGRRIGNLEELRREIGAWATDVNERQRGVDWQMTVTAARYKLKSVYPQIVT